MLEFILSWLVLAFAVWVTSLILPAFRLKGTASALIVAVLFGVLNFFLGWFFFAVLGIATLGIGFLFAFITRWIVNAIILKIADAATDHLTIDGFGWALVAAALMSAIGTVGEWAVHLIV